MTNREYTLKKLRELHEYMSTVNPKDFHFSRFKLNVTKNKECKTLYCMAGFLPNISENWEWRDNVLTYIPQDMPVDVQILAEYYRISEMLARHIFYPRSQSKSFGRKRLVENSRLSTVLKNLKEVIEKVEKGQLDGQLE